MKTSQTTRAAVIGLSLLVLVAPAAATDLDFSFTVNPDPYTGYSGTTASGDYFEPDSTYYGSGIADGSAYGAWLRRDATPPGDWVNPQAQHTDGGVGWTPDIDVTFPAGEPLEKLYFEPAYGDLDDVMYLNSSASGQGWFLGLKDDNTDAAINPVLHSFDLAYYGGGTLAEVQVATYDGSRVATLWSATNVAIASNGHVTIDFGGTPIEGTEVSMWIGFTTQAGQPLYNVALDNVIFSQTPEPAGLLLGLLGLGWFIRRRA